MASRINEDLNQIVVRIQALRRGAPVEVLDELYPHIRTLNKILSIIRTIKEKYGEESLEAVVFTQLGEEEITVTLSKVHNILGRL